MDPTIKELIMDSNKKNITFDQISFFTLFYKKYINLVGLEKEKNILFECLIYPNLRPDIFKGIRSPPRGILFITCAIY